MESLPQELLTSILSHMPTKRELLTCMLVSKTWLKAGSLLYWEQTCLLTELCESFEEFSSFKCVHLHINRG